MHPENITLGEAFREERLARETSYRTPKDNLTLDVMDAERAGMSYGQYKALHPNTRDANERRLAAKPITEPKPRLVYEIICCTCGKKFITPNRLRRYCDNDCKVKKDSAKYRAKHSKKEMEA